MAAAQQAGVKSRVEVESNPVVPVGGKFGAPHTWSFMFFVLAVLVILGFHIRIFGRAVPPATHNLG